jgi:hypothetical protein
MSTNVSALNTVNPANTPPNTNGGGLLVQMSQTTPKIPNEAKVFPGNAQPRQEIREPQKTPDGLIPIPREKYRGRTILVQPQNNNNRDGMMTRENVAQRAVNTGRSMYKPASADSAPRPGFTSSNGGGVLAQISQSTPKIPREAMGGSGDWVPKSPIRMPGRPYNPETDGLIKIPRLPERQEPPEAPPIFGSDDLIAQKNRVNVDRYMAKGDGNSSVSNARAMPLSVPDDGGVRFNQTSIQKSVSLKQLVGLNPSMSKTESPAKLNLRSIDMFERKSAFLKEGPTGMVLAKEINLGGGAKLPVGTVIVGSGPKKGDHPLYSVDYKPVLTFKLPSGKEITMIPSVRIGPQGTDIIFPDGKKATLAGAPFFNAKAGTLGWVNTMRTTNQMDTTKFGLTDPLATRLEPEARVSLAKALQ